MSRRRDLTDTIFFLSGAFRSHPQRKLREALESAGATVMTKVSGRPPDIVVAGSKPSRNVAPLLEAGVTSWTEWQLLDVLGMSQTVSTRTERLRELVSKEPSEKAWDALCVELRRCPDAELAMAVAYLEPYLNEWPARGRNPRKAWWSKLLRTGSDPRMRLVKQLNLFDAGVSGAKAVRLAGSADAANLTYLNLSWNRVGDDGARALVHSPHLRALEHLDLSQNRITQACATELLAHPARQLEVLDFGALGGRRKPRGIPAWQRIWAGFVKARKPLGHVPETWYPGPGQRLLRPPRGLTLLSASGPVVYDAVEAVIDWDNQRIHFAEADLRDGLEMGCGGTVEGIEFLDYAQRNLWPCTPRSAYGHHCSCGFRA
jgi:hypothetical protein